MAAADACGRTDPCGWPLLRRESYRQGCQVVLEHRRRAEADSFWLTMPGQPCCGTMQHCLLKAVSLGNVMKIQGHSKPRLSCLGLGCRAGCSHHRSRLTSVEELNPSDLVFRLEPKKTAAGEAGFLFAGSTVTVRRAPKPTTSS